MSTITTTTSNLYVPLEYATGRVCTDCRMLHANGYTPDDMSDDERDEYLARVDAHTAGYTNVAIGAGYDECSHDADDMSDADDHSENCDSLGFMVNSSCDSCGSHEGGTRYAATFFLPRRVNLVKARAYPVFVLSSNDPGCLPDNDAPLALHTGTAELDADATEAFVDMVATAYDEHEEALIEDRDTRTHEDVYVFSLDATELDDAISAYGALASSVRSTTSYDSIGADIRRGVHEALRRGLEYSYTVVDPEDRARSYFIAPLADEHPVCSEFDGDEYEYASCEYGCTPRP
jgi:hypothetical protein